MCILITHQVQAFDSILYDHRFDYWSYYVSFVHVNEYDCSDDDFPLHGKTRLQLDNILLDLVNWAKF